MKATIYIGDVLERLRELPDESVQCVVTSPPYWGLRDYGTGQWQGGDAECDHRQYSAAVIEKSDSTRTIFPTASGNHAQVPQYKTTCGKCGATRIDQQLGLEKTPSCGAHGLMRLRRDLTDEQRVYVVQRLLGVAGPDAPHGDKHGNE